MDEHGRHALFHGVNVVYKVAPFIPSDGNFTIDTSLDDEDIDNLHKWGMNFVRLGVTWESVERQPGVYNETYLDEVEKLINKLGDKGIHTLVDMHQDVLSRQTCGEGMPFFYAKEVIERSSFCLSPTVDWLLSPLYKATGFCKSVKDYGMRFDEDGNPLIEDCQKFSFGDFYLSPEVISVFRALYHNEGGLQDKFVAYWQKVSSRFAANPNVVGFDPINEPCIGFTSFANALNTIWPGNMDREILAPMYTRIFEKIKAASPDAVMMFEPPVAFPEQQGLSLFGH